MEEAILGRERSHRATLSVSIKDLVPQKGLGSARRTRFALSGVYFVPDSPSIRPKNGGQEIG